MQFDSTQNVHRRIVGPLALVAALTLALAPSSALAAPAKPKPRPKPTSINSEDYLKITLQEVLITS
jgi:hypothetical protein